MQRSILPLLICRASVSLTAASYCRGESAPTNFSLVDEHEPEMAAAIAEARKSLPEFWQIATNPKIFA